MKCRFSNSSLVTFLVVIAKSIISHSSGMRLSLEVQILGRLNQTQSCHQRATATIFHQNYVVWAQQCEDGPRQLVTCFSVMQRL